MSVHLGSLSTPRHRQNSTDSVEKGGSAAAGQPGAPSFEVAASHFKLPFGDSLSVWTQV
jgi:hypothetical protein